MSTENLLRPQASGIPRQHTGLSGQGAYNSSVNLEKLFCDGSLCTGMKSDRNPVASYHILLVTVLGLSVSERVD